ncbi:MAG: FAD-binding oxidoreductase [Myxococcales bacterium]|nr:FAD-binding oxidoreductase [Myxococcales bacterium]
MPSKQIVVIGGGIAGLSATWRLAERGAEVLLLERESVLAAHSSGRNAAIWMPIEDDRSTGMLARLSATLLDGLIGAGRWSIPRGALVLAETRGILEGAERGARASGLRTRRLDAEEARLLSPALEPDSSLHALHIPEAAELDIHAMHEAIARRARALGARLRLRAEVEGIVTAEGRVRGVRLLDGEPIEAARVVIAGGAWAQRIGRSAGSPLPITPLRRHLHLLEARPPRAGCIVWRYGAHEAYYRPETNGVLACACDEERVEPSLPEVAPAAAEGLALRLQRLAPELTSAALRRSWGCLRTFAPDRELVIGEDPRLRGLSWLAGLGGRGMSVGVGAAELLARLLLAELCAEELGRMEIFSPSRLLAR